MPVNSSFLIYGATGYTGSLIARACKGRGLRPTLAGRDEKAVRKLAESLDLPWRCASLTSSKDLLDCVGGHALVLHCAGPFSHTSEPMVAACFEAGAHYLDICGELTVLRNMYALHSAALERKLLLVPGVGCDVVASNCLTMSLCERLPEIVDLELTCDYVATPSRGTLKTLFAQLPHESCIVEDSQYKRVPFGLDYRTEQWDGRTVHLTSAPWGDLAAAERATGIANVRVFMALPWTLAMGAANFGKLAPLAAADSVQRPLQWLAERFPKGPSAKQRAHGHVRWYAEATDSRGKQVSGSIEVIEPHTFTAYSAVRAVMHALRTDVRGALAPAQAFGIDFANEIEGTQFGENR